MEQVKLPKNLDMNGFKNGKILDEDIIDISLLTDIKGYIAAELSKRKTINLKHSSYGLKHKCEKYLEKYVSNGQFIASMILVGYRYKQDGINAYFNIETIK